MSSSAQSSGDSGNGNFPVGDAIALFTDFPQMYDCWSMIALFSNYLLSKLKKKLKRRFAAEGPGESPGGFP